jgi:hypothetical protein
MVRVVKIDTDSIEELTSWSANFESDYEVGIKIVNKIIDRIEQKGKHICHGETLDDRRKEALYEFSARTRMYWAKEARRLHSSYMQINGNRNGAVKARLNEATYNELAKELAEIYQCDVDYYFKTLNQAQEA